MYIPAFTLQSNHNSTNESKVHARRTSVLVFFYVLQYAYNTQLGSPFAVSSVELNNNDFSASSSNDHCIKCSRQEANSIGVTYCATAVLLCTVTDTS